MREIKFRAWIKTENTMTDVSDLYYDETGWNKVTGNQKLVAIAYRKNKEAYRSDFEIMQCTGLEDMNGVEIYEGDIVRTYREVETYLIRDSGGGIIDVDFEEGFSQLGVISYTSCSFSYETIKTLDGKDENIKAPVDWLENYEVIGNIYENPELLKE